MNLEEVRELMHKLNLGVGRATSITAWKTEMRDNADGEPLGVERVDQVEFALGHIGGAQSVDDDNDDIERD